MSHSAYTADVDRGEVATRFATRAMDLHEPMIGIHGATVWAWSQHLRNCQSVAVSAVRIPYLAQAFHLPRQSAPESAKLVFLPSLYPDRVMLASLVAK